jgi:hypothetical protein
MTTHQRKYINVRFGLLTTRIRTDEIEDLSELQDLIKAKYSNARAGIDAPQLQLYKSYPEERIARMADFRALPNDFFVEDGGLALEIHTSPPPTRQSSMVNVQPSPAAIQSYLAFNMEYAAARNEYLVRAEYLKDDPATQEMVQLIEDVITTNKKEFIFHALSSGMGKTQMAHTLMKCFEGKRKVFYVLGQRFGETSQPVYQYYNNITIFFHECVNADMKNLKDNELDSDFLSSRHLYVFGFIMKLLDEGNSQGICRIVPELGKNVDQRWGASTNEKPVIIIDEYGTAGDQSPAQLRFIRNCFRAVGLNPLLMGTNTSAADIIEHSQPSRSISKKWVRIFTGAPKVTERSCGFDQLGYEGSCYYDLIKHMILNSRPLFAVEAVRYLQEHVPVGDFVTYLDNMLDSLHDRFVWWKKIGSNSKTQRGQILLTLNSSYALTDIAEESSLIHRHYANLHTGANVLELNLDDGKLLCKSIQGALIPWVPVVLFPTPKEDALLHLTMIGTKNRSGIFVMSKSQVFRRPFMNLMYEVRVNVETRENGFKFKSCDQRSNDGNFLEACMASTIVHASHMNGVAGIGFKDFLPQLAYELYPGEDAIAGPGKLTGQLLTACNDRRIPFLLAPNQELDRDFIKACHQAGAFFSTCERTINAKRIDFAAMNMGLSGEAKDYAKDLDIDIMKTILERVPKDSAIHIVMTRRLQKSYFTQYDFKEYASNLDNLKPMPAFFVMEPVFDSENMVVNAELSWIRGLPHDGSASHPVGRIVLFVIVPERRAVVTAE